jgi:hypothetical protein
MDIKKHKRNQYRHHDGYDRSSYKSAVEKRDHGKHKKDDGHKPSCQTVQSIGDIDGIDDTDSDEEGKDRIQYSDIYLACDRPEIDEIDAEFAIKPPTDESCENYHPYHFGLRTQSFDPAVALDIEEIIHQSYESHAKESEKQDVCFLSGK